MYRIIRMLDITSYRRKQKYAQPLTVMRELYHEYARGLKSKTACPTAAEDPLARQTLSLDRFGKCLRQLQIKNDGEPNINLQVVKNCNSFRISDEKVGKLKNISTQQSSFPLSTTKKQQSIYNKKINYFNSAFSSTISLFNAHPGIKRLELTENCILQQSKDKKKPQILNILFERKQLQMRNPTQLFTQMIKQKNDMENFQNAKKKNLRKIRHDWIVGNLYHKPESGEQQNIQQNRPRCRTRDLFSTTKQNIFPQLNNL